MTDNYLGGNENGVLLKKKIGWLALALMFIGGTVAIIILTVMLVKSGKRLRALKIQYYQLESQVVNMTSAQSSDSALQKSEFYRRDFVSHADKKADSYLLAPPTIPPSDNKYTLIVYMHGMGSNYLEPYIVAKKKPIAPAIKRAYPSFMLASLNYRQQNGWGNELSVSDINQNIREVCQAYPVDRIILMGTSMGGCVVLNYAAVAPPEIKSKIVGVVSVEGSGSLKDLYDSTSQAVVKLGIREAMGGTPEEKPDNYSSASLLSHLDSVSKSVRFAIVSAKSDRTVPASLQKNVIEALSKGNYPNKLFELNLDHEFPEPEVYVEGLKFIESSN